MKEKRSEPRQAPAEIIGIDLGDKVSCYCALNQEGERSEEGRFRNTEVSLQKHFGSLPRARVA